MMLQNPTASSQRWHSADCAERPFGDRCGGASSSHHIPAPGDFYACAHPV